MSKMQNQPALALENIPLFKITEIICDHFQIKPEHLTTGSKVKRLTIAKSMIAYFAHYHAKLKLIDIAAYFCMTPGGLSRTLHKNLMLSKTDISLQYTMNILEKRLSMPDTANRDS